MLETLPRPITNPGLPKFTDPSLEALQQNLIKREQSGEFAPPTFDLKNTLSTEINLSNNDLNYGVFRDFTLGKNKLINEAINEYTDILSVLNNYSVSTPDQQSTGGWKEKIGQKFGDFKKAVTQNNIVKFTRRGIQTVGQVAQNSINDVKKGIIGSATVNAFGGSEKIVKPGFGYSAFYADTVEHVGKSLDSLEGKINSQIQQKWSNISPEDQKIIQDKLAKLNQTTNNFRLNLTNADSQGKTVTNYYGAEEEKLQTKGRLTTTGAITLASAAFGPLGYAAIATRTVVNASIGEVKGLSEQTLKSQRENLEKELVLEDLQNIALLLDNLGDQKISPILASQISENFKWLNNSFLLTGAMEAEYIKIEGKLNPELHPEYFIKEGEEIPQNSQLTDTILSEFSNKLDATTAKVLGQEFIKTVESEFNDPKKRLLRIGMVVGAGVAGLAFSAWAGRPLLQGLYKTIFQHGETVTLPTQSGNIRLQSSHAPLDGYKVLSQQGDLLVVGKEGQTLPTDGEIATALDNHFKNTPTIEGAKVSDFKTPDGRILEGVRMVEGKTDGKTGILITDQNNPVVSYDDTPIRFDKGTSGSGLDFEKYQDQTVVGKYGDQLVVADKNTSPQVIDELNRIQGIEKYATLTNQSLPTTSEFGQQTFVIPYGTSVNPNENLFAAPLPTVEDFSGNSNVSNPGALENLQRASGNTATTNTPLPGSDLGIKNDLTFGDGIISSNETEYAKFKIGVELDSLSRQLSDPAKLTDPNFNQLGVMAKVTQLNSLKQELENLKPGQTIKLSDNLDFNLIGKDGSVGVSSNTLARVANLTDAKKLGINDNIITSDERTRALGSVQDNLRELKKIEGDSNLSVADKALVSQKIKELTAIKDGLNLNENGGTIQEVNGKLSFKGSSVVETPASQVPKIPKESSLPEAKGTPEPEVVNGVTDPGSNLAGGKFERLISNDPELQKILKDDIQKGEIGDLITRLKKLAGTNREMIDAVNKMDKKLEIYFYDANNAGKSVKFDGIATVEKGKLDILLEADGKTLDNLPTNAPQVPAQTNTNFGQQTFPPINSSSTFNKGDITAFESNPTNPNNEYRIWNRGVGDQTTPVLPANQTQPTVPRVPDNAGEPRPIPTPSTQTEFVGSNTTDFSKIYSPDSQRGGITDIFRLTSVSADQPIDPQIKIALDAYRVNNPNFTLQDFRSTAEVTGLYRLPNGQYLTGEQLRKAINFEISTPAQIRTFLSDNRIESVGGMGISAFNGNPPTPDQIKLWQSASDRLIREYAVDYDPENPTVVKFRSLEAEANYRIELMKLRESYIELLGRKDSQWRSDNDAVQWAGKVYDNGNATANQPIQGSAVLGSETNNNENIAQIRQNQPLASNTTPQNLANQQPGSNGNGVNGANSNLTPGAANNTIETPNNNSSPSNFRLGGQMMTSDDVTNTFVRGANISNLNRNIFANEPGGNPTYNDTRWTAYKPWPLQGEAFELPFGGQDQPTLRVMPNPYGPDGNLRSANLMQDPDFSSRWFNGLQQGQTTDLYDPKHPGYVLTVDDKGNLTNLKIPDDATQPPAQLQFRALISDRHGNIKTNLITVDAGDTAPVASGNGTNPTNIPPASSGGTTPPVQPTARAFNVAQIGDPERSDVATARESFNSDGTIEGLDINQDIPGTGQLWQADLMKKNIANMTGKDYNDNWNDLQELAYSGDAKGTEFGNIITEIDKMIPASLSSENRVKIFDEVDTLLEGLAKIDPKDPNAETMAEGLLNDYFNITDGILLNANIAQTNGGNWYDYPLAFMAAGLWITGGTAVGLAQGRYAIDPRLSRPGLFRAVDSDNAVPPNQSALGNFINRTYNNPLINRFDPRRLRLETYKDAVVSIAGLFTGPFGWGLTLGTGVARYIADRNPSEEDPQRIVGNQHFR